jgi:hypothetical protein
MSVRGFATAILLLGAVFVSGCSREVNRKPEAAHSQTYVTRKSLEPDKLASIWLIKRHVDKDAQFNFVADDIPLTNGIPFDTPEAEFRRYANLSCFESILKKHQITDRAVQRLGQLIHDIEINYWGEKRYPESEPLNQEIRSLIKENETNRESCLELSLLLFDRVCRDFQRNPPSQNPRTQ